MRLFQERLTTIPRASLTLLLWDYIAIASAAVYATGVLHGPGQLIDSVCLVLWALIPRSLGRFLGWLERPKSTFVLVITMLLFLFIVAGLAAIGIELLTRVCFNAEGVRRYSPFLVLITWFAGFLLAYPSTYKAHDALLGGTIVIGLIERMPLAMVWIPLFLLGLCLSATTRHVIIDIHALRPGARVNIQNARVIGISAALLGSLLFLVGVTGLRPIVAAVSGVESPGSSGDSTSQDDDGLPLGIMSPDESGIPVRPATQGERPTARVLRNRGRGIGYPEQNVGLSDLSPPTRDPRVVLRIQTLREQGFARWQPSPGTLWRAATLTRFNGATEEWVVDPAEDVFSWPDDGTVPVQAPSRRFSRHVGIRVTVTLPVIRSLVAPYDRIRLGNFSRESTEQGYRTNSADDIYPEAGLVPGDTYDAFFREPTAEFPIDATRNSSGSHRIREYLEVPGAEDIGIDLYQYARQVFTGTASIGDRVEAVSEHFADKFQYNHEDLWSRSGGRLNVFLAERKVGDCVYFATATALLLRCGGISTRLATGFLGGTYDRGAYVVVNRDAHTWVEVWVPRMGWIPLDTTRYTPQHPEYEEDDTPPVDPLEDPEAAARYDDSNTEDSSTDAGSSFEEPSPRSSNPDRTQQPPQPSRFGDEDDFDSQGSNDGSSDPDFENSTALGGTGQPSLNNEGEFGDAMRGGPGSNRPGPGGEAKEAPRKLYTSLIRAALLLMVVVTILLTALSFLRPKKETEDPVEEGELDALPGTLSLQFTDPGTPPETADEEILYHYIKLQRTLTPARRHRRGGETPMEHRTRFEGRNSEVDSAFTTLVGHVYTALYDETESTDEGVAESKQSCRTIGKHLG